MRYLLPSFSCLLLLISHNIAVEEVNFYSIQRDLDEFNKTCLLETCESRESFFGSLPSRSCHCGIQCVQLGTCCADSYYVRTSQPQLKPACQSINEKSEAYFMFDQCPTDSPWASLCNDEWSGEDDLQKIVPVTSLLSSNTYKNYYCLKCHEATDEFLYWNVVVESNLVQSVDKSKLSHRNVSLTYSKDLDTWMAIYDEDIGYFPVNISMQIPLKINALVHECMRNLITDCPNDWYDVEVRDKCQSYMGIKEVSGINGSKKYYKNIHCALCNLESLNDIACKDKPAPSGRGSKPFDFTYLLDINRSDGELVGKVLKCPDDDEIWDPFTSKCRKITCAKPGFTVKDGKCVEG